MTTGTFDVQASLDATGRQKAEGAIKIREDLARYRTVIDATQPEVIVECGTYCGGSARWFRSLGPEVITVDISAIVSPVDGVTCVCGDSKDPATVESVISLVAGRRTMVVLDSDHSAAHVAAEITAYGPLVTPGCYLVVEDGIVRWMDGEPYQGSPLDAIEDLLVGSPEWERDTEVEGMFPVTMYPAGWWRRVSRVA